MRQVYRINAVEIRQHSLRPEQRRERAGHDHSEREFIIAGRHRRRELHGIVAFLDDKRLEFNVEFLLDLTCALHERVVYHVSVSET